MEVLLPRVTRTSDTSDTDDSEGYCVTAPGPPPDAAALLTGQTQQSLTWLTTAPGWTGAVAVLQAMQAVAVGDDESTAVAAAEGHLQMQRYLGAQAVIPSPAIRKALGTDRAKSVKAADSVNWSTVDLPPPEVLLTKLTEPLTAVSWSSQQLLEGCSRLLQLLQVDSQPQAVNNSSSSSSSSSSGTDQGNGKSSSNSATAAVKVASQLSPAALLQQPLLLQQLQTLLTKLQQSLDSNSSSSSSSSSFQKKLSFHLLASAVQVATAATTLPHAIATLPARDVMPGDTLTKAAAAAESAAVAGKQLLETVLQLMLTRQQLKFDPQGLQQLLLAAGEAAAVAGQQELLQQVLLLLLRSGLLQQQQMGGELLGFLKVRGRGEHVCDPF